MRTSPQARYRHPVAREGKRRRRRSVVAIMSPWNYPVNLALAPAVRRWQPQRRHYEAVGARSGDLAALARADQWQQQGAIAVVEGGASVVEAIIDAGVDHLIYTRGTRPRAPRGDGVGSSAPDAGDAGARREEPGDRLADADLRVSRRTHRLGRFPQRRTDVRTRPTTSSSTPPSKLASRRTYLRQSSSSSVRTRKRAARTHASSTSPTLTGSCSCSTDTAVKCS